MSLGTEKRFEILPSIHGEENYAPPSYNPADELYTPGQIGVKRDDTISSVMGAIKGVGYYTDMIGFGQSSNNWTRGMDLYPLGINYFMPTGQTCSNGAAMYHYVEGIPRGDAVGRNVSRALSEMGLPEMRGLAPGIIEDVQEATDPTKFVAALFGGAYPMCKKARMRVGDAKGRIKNDAGEEWIKGSVEYGNDGYYYQTHWIYDRGTTKKEYDCTPKLSGASLPDNCYYEEGFTDGKSRKYIGVIAAACIAAIIIRTITKN
jgi:hypothetical protein